MSTLTFDDFELDVRLRRLRRSGADLKLGARAFDILTALASRPGEIVSKEELISQVWPNTVVTEGSLRVHLVELRKVLGGGDNVSIIQSVPGRGYILSASVQRQSLPTPSTSPRSKLNGSLPNLLSQVFGRDEYILACLAPSEHRLMTIVGPGGIGKTTVAIKLANLLKDQFEAAFFVDLAALKDAASIAPTLASLIGLSVYGDDPVPGIARALGDKKVLLIFDNCEHVIQHASSIVERILRECGNVVLLATSREPLGLRFESVKRLGPLTLPERDGALSSIAKTPAIALFIDRVQQSVGGNPFETIEQMHLVAEIVRRLDGIPLAIEFAAARVVDLGLEELLRSLDQPLMVLRRGRRTAAPRHQTLRATLDWSYGFLTQAERTVIQRVSVFAQWFTREGVGFVSTSVLSREQVDDAIWGLLSKSLLFRSDAGDSYRLLETTKDYSTHKLSESGDEGLARKYHAMFIRDRMRDCERDWEKLGPGDWVRRYAYLVHDLRTSLSFCEATHDEGLFLELVAASGVLWTQLGLMNEQFLYIERALEIIDARPDNDPWIETQLRSSYGAIAYNVRSEDADAQAVHQFDLAGKAARTLGDTTRILRAGSGICAVLTTQGKYREASEFAKNLGSEVGEEAGPAVNRILAHNSHYLGLHNQAYELAEKALAGHGANSRGTLTSGANFGQKTLSLMIMAKTAWIRGETDSCLEMLGELVEGSLEMDHAISTCLALSVGACPIYFGMGDMELGKSHLELLRDVSTRHSLIRWQQWADGFDYAIGEVDDDHSRTVAGLHRGGNGPRLENIVMLGGKRVEPRLLELALNGEAGWCVPELLRIKGETLLDAGNPTGLDLVERGYRIASEQSALTWRLRCAKSLVRYSGEKAANSARARLEHTLSMFKQRVPKRALECALEILG